MASASDQLKRGALVVGVFAVIGLGIGLTAYFPISYITNHFQGGFVGPILTALLAMQSTLLVVLVAPLVAGIAGLLNGYADADPRVAMVTSGVAAFIGFYVMVALAGVLIISGFDSGGAMGGGATPTPVGASGPTPTPAGIVIEVETPTPVQLSADSGSLRAVAVGGIPAGIVGAVTSGLGFWFRESSDLG